MLKNIPTFDILTKKTISIMEINFLAVLVAALSSFVVGFVWYNPKVFGTIWMNEIGMTEEKAKQGNMAKIFGLTFVFAFMLAFIMMPITIHQFGALGMVGGDETKAFLLIQLLWQIIKMPSELLSMVLCMDSWLDYLLLYQWWLRIVCSNKNHLNTQL